jgi:uncharacterized protein YxeA
MSKILFTIIGIVIAAIGGVIAYRAWFLDPHAAIVITETQIKEVPNYARVMGGCALLVVGSALALYSATRRTR